MKTLPCKNYTTLLLNYWINTYNVAKLSSLPICILTDVFALYAKLMGLYMERIPFANLRGYIALSQKFCHYTRHKNSDLVCANPSLRIDKISGMVWFIPTSPELLQESIKISLPGIASSEFLNYYKCLTSKTNPNNFYLINIVRRKEITND